MVIRNIQPVTIFPHAATKFAFSSANVYPDLSAEIFWQLLDDKETVLQTGSVPMNTEEYNQWGTDDSYPLYFAAGKLGLTVID